jgi:hypothetical protein
MSDRFTLSKANWGPYFGNNHERIERPDVTAFGHVSFASHFGKPLSQGLWEDLIHRMTISGLCIYRPGDMQWAIGWGSGHCCVYLDSQEQVKDIHYCPIVRPYVRKEESNV